MNKSHDVCIIGAGHNGLVSSIILARAGLSVKVHEGKKLAEVRLKQKIHSS